MNQQIIINEINTPSKEAVERFNHQLCQIIDNYAVKKDLKRGEKSDQ